MKNLKNNSEKGFALPLALLLLVVMTIMGATLVNITSTEHNANTNKDSNQQTFYAAESGISVAKSWMVGNISKFSSSPPNNLDGQLRFCRASFFPSLKSSNNGFLISEEDMKIRGFGDLLGFKQSGIKNFKLADPIHNHDLFILAEKEIRRIEKSNENIGKFKPLIKLYDRADIINDII